MRPGAPAATWRPCCHSDPSRQHACLVAERSPPRPSVAHLEESASLCSQVGAGEARSLQTMIRAQVRDSVRAACVKLHTGCGVNGLGWS